MAVKIYRKETVRVQVSVSDWLDVEDVGDQGKVGFWENASISGLATG